MRLTRHKKCLKIEKVIIMTWIVENLATLIVGIVVLAAIVAALIVMIKNKKSGKTGCSGNCAGCAVNCNKKSSH